MPIFKNKNESTIAYFLFEKEVKKQVKKENPKKKEYEISNIIAKMWIEGEPSKRLKYYDEERRENTKKIKNPLYRR